MIDTVLIPAGTVLTAKGDSPAVEVATAENRSFLLTFNLTEAVEQELVELSLMRSVDGVAWAPRPLASLPQVFYPGSYPTLIDLSKDLETNFVRVHWELSRWGRGELTPKVTCGLTLREVSREMLQQARP